LVGGLHEIRTGLHEIEKTFRQPSVVGPDGLRQRNLRIARSLERLRF
jgi:hypothetical protein